MPDSATSSLPWPTASAVGEEPMPSARATLSVCSTSNEFVSITDDLVGVGQRDERAVAPGVERDRLGVREVRADLDRLGDLRRSGG